MRFRHLPAALFAVAVHAAAAQRVRVQVVADESGAPIRAAVVSLLSAANATVSEGLTDADGARLLAAPATGLYRVRVRRIGFEPFVSDAVRLDSGVIKPLVIRVPNSRVTLAAVRVVAQRQDCRVGATVSSGEAAAVWEQIKTALATSELSRRDSVVRTEVRTFTRELSPKGEVLQAQTAARGEAGARPFVAPDPAALVRTGYVIVEPDMGATYWAPDASVLASPAFAETHCFGLVPGEGKDSSLVGLTFEPTRDRDLPDIAGTLWVDRDHLALQRLDFDYVKLRLPARVRDVGGEVDFASLPSGGWYPSFWRIRMPRFRRGGAEINQQLFILAGYTEAGGLASPVEEIGKVRLAATRPELTEVKATTVVAVTMTDAGARAPLSGAQIELPDAGFNVRSDSTGRAVLARVPRGTQRFRARRVGFVPIDTTIAVTGDTLSIQLLVDRNVPLLDTIRIHAEPVQLRMQAFETRRAMGVGRFLTDSALARDAMRPLPFALVTHFPGLRLVQVPPSPAGRLCDDPQCAGTADQPPGTMHIEAVGSSGILADTSPTCPVDVYVDGFFYTEDMEAVPTSTVAAAELYDKSSAPPQYRRAGKACKVLLLWTRSK
ncbi:MAG TPA: carboxypeptidase regulatory-like domain-containing protein [Gemmatimonadaceae bacterium]